MIVPHLHSLADLMLPDGASNLAPDVDQAWKIILFVTGFFFCVVVGVMTYFVIRYRRRTPNQKAVSEVTHNTPLEIAWTGIPLLLVMGFFYIGFRGFLNYDTPRSDSIVIDVEAKKWNFTFTYPNGAQDGSLYLLKDQAVRLNLHSTDVLHGIYLPNFRTQRNLIPGRQTTIWFIPTELSPAQGVHTDPKTGTVSSTIGDGWPIFCTQYCGDGHSRMFTHVYVLDKPAFDEKMKELANPFKKKLPSGKSVFVPYVTLGETLYKQIGCATCHTIDNTVGSCPPWKGLWKRDHVFPYNAVPGYSLSASDSDEKWEAYIKDTVMNPDAKTINYNGTIYHGMPSFASQLSGSTTNDEKLRAIMAFIKSLGNTGWKPDVTPEDNANLFDADDSPLKDDQGVPVPPESLAGIALRKKLGLTNATSSQPASTSQPGN